MKNFRDQEFILLAISTNRIDKSFHSNTRVTPKLPFTVIVNRKKNYGTIKLSRKPIFIENQ